LKCAYDVPDAEQIFKITRWIAEDLKNLQQPKKLKRMRFSFFGCRFLFCWKSLEIVLKSICRKKENSAIVG